MEAERAVRERYGEAAQEREEALCCPVDYDQSLLEIIPAEVIERDYGCGDPSRYVSEGDTVLDLGSGGGKICFMAAQIVGKDGRVIGVDMNDEMLSLANRAKPQVAKQLGYDNVSFHRGRIQDLALDPNRLDTWLAEHPVENAAEISAFEDACADLRRTHPLIPDASIDIVVSNCVLNLVRASDKPRLIEELHRVLKPGGRIAISDIISDRPVPQELMDDPELWSGCISGAFEREELLQLLEQVGFRGLTLDQWGATPFRVIGEIEFRSVTVTAQKPAPTACGAAGASVIYRGPWSRVEDGSGTSLERGKATRVSAATAQLLRSEAFKDHIIEVGVDTEDGSCCG